MHLWVGEEEDAILILNFTDNTVFCFAIFLQFLRRFLSNLLLMSSLCLPRYFYVKLFLKFIFLLDFEDFQNVRRQA